MSTLLTFLADTGHDQLWLLLAAQRMGPHLNPYGPLVFESNPPLAIWLSAIVVQLAHLLHLSLTVTFKLAATLLAAGSAIASAKLLSRLHPALSRNQLWLLGIAFILIFGAVPVRDFGQRDHILALLVLPYLVAAALDLAGRRLALIPRIAIALAAAFGLALKPHQALIAIAIEATLLLTHNRRVPHLMSGTIGPEVGSRRRILEPAVFLAAALAYLTAIRTFAPTYLTQILPILRDTYWAFGHLHFLEVLQAAIGLHALLAITLILYLFRRPKPPLILILLAAGVGATLAYIAQGTGWYYQQLPAISFVALALTLQIIGGHSEQREKGGHSEQREESQYFASWCLPAATAALTLLAFVLTTYFSDFHHTPRGIEQTQSIPDPAFFADLAPGTAVATLTTSVDDTVPPAFRYHLTLAQRYPHLWMLPAILRNESGPVPSHRIPQPRLAELDRLQHQFMVEDLQHWHPALILVERCQNPEVHCQVLEDRHDDLLAWFLRDPTFALLFSKYHFVRSSGPYDAYTLN